MFRHPEMSMIDANMNANIQGNNNVIDQDMNIDVNMNNGMMMQGGHSCCQNPVNEAVREKCVHKTIVHEVPHVCPIHTRVINHHVYKHTYRPAYTCSQENVVSNVQEGSCCNFR